MVPELDEITTVENDYALPSGKPRLGDAYTMLKARWVAGRRDLETGLRLMFLAWYTSAEPPFLTGLPTQEDTGPIFGKSLPTSGEQRPLSRNCFTLLG